MNCTIRVAKLKALTAQLICAFVFALVQIRISYDAAQFAPIGSHTVIIGKCSNPSFEEALLQTIARLTDTTGARLLSSAVTAIATAIKACH